MKLYGAEDLLSLSFCSNLFSTVELFLPHIAVAFGYASSFSHPKALSFSMDKLFMPNFGPDLSIKLLDSLRENVNLNGVFDRFSGFSVSGIPMDPDTFEVFDIENYLPELQFSLDLAPKVEFAAPNFRASDLFDAVFPTSLPTLQSFISFMKKDIMSKIQIALDGLFEAKVNVPTAGLSVDAVSFGEDGINLGEWTEFNNKLFPPMINVDVVQVSILLGIIDICTLPTNEKPQHIMFVLHRNLRLTSTLKWTTGH